MFFRRMLPIVLIILWLWPSSLYAQSEALMEAYNQGQALYEAGRYEQAIPHLRKALELGEQEFGPDHSRTARLLNNFAALYHAQGRYEVSVASLNRSLMFCVLATLKAFLEKMVANINAACRQRVNSGSIKQATRTSAFGG